jgi:hypothetical protein
MGNLTTTGLPPALSHGGMATTLHAQPVRKALSFSPMPSDAFGFIIIINVALHPVDLRVRINGTIFVNLPKAIVITTSLGVESASQLRTTKLHEGHFPGEKGVNFIVSKSFTSELASRK